MSGVKDLSKVKEILTKYNLAILTKYNLAILSYNTTKKSVGRSILTVQKKA